MYEGLQPRAVAFLATCLRRPKPPPGFSGAVLLRPFRLRRIRCGPGNWQGRSRTAFARFSASLSTLAKGRGGVGCFSGRIEFCRGPAPLPTSPRAARKGRGGSARFTCCRQPAVVGATQVAMAYITALVGATQVATICGNTHRRSRALFRSSFPHQGLRGAFRAELSSAAAPPPSQHPPALRARGGADRRASRAAGNPILWERRKSRWSVAELSVSYIHHSEAFVRCAAGSFLLLAHEAREARPNGEAGPEGASAWRESKKRTKEKGLPRRSTSAKPIRPGCSDSPILGSVGTRRTSLCVALRVWRYGCGFVSGARQIDEQSPTPNFIVTPANVENQIL